MEGSLASYYISGIAPHIMNCTRQLYSQQLNGTDLEEWIYITNDVLYYAYPCVLFLALLACLFSTLASASMLTDSHECYFTAFNVSSLLMIIVTIVIQLPNYFPMMDSSHYLDLLAYLPATENWCWYFCTWSLFTAVIERAGHAMCGRWNASFGRVHGILASLLLVVVCFVFTLPQYWEYQISNLVESYGEQNCTRIVIAPRDTVLKTEGAGYVPEYYYFNWIVLVFSIGLPYLIMPILLPLMCCVKMHSYTALSTHGGTISTYADDYNIKDDVKDERNFNRLLGVLVLCYLIMSGPRNAARLLHNPPLFLSLCDSQLFMDTLVLLFEVVFYIQFVFIFFIAICMSDKFKLSLKSLFCKCCSKRN